MKRRLMGFLLALPLLLPAMSVGVHATSETFSSISASSFSSFAITQGGDLYAWGGNSSGQLGDGTTEPRAMPYLLMSGVREVSGSTNFTLAVKTDNTLWGWGENYQGMLGGEEHGETVLAPTLLMENVVAVQADYVSAFALKTDGSLVGWGSDHFGGTEYQRVPLDEPLVLAQGVKDFSSGGKYIFYVTSGGELYGSASSNTGGYLGAGEEYDGPNAIAPVKLLDGVRQVSTNGNSTLAVLEDDSLWVWGSNTSGALGDGDAHSRNAPYRLMEDVRSAVTGGSHMMAIKTDGTLWAWGHNGYGQLGDGTTVTRSEPVQVMEDVVAVSTNYHTLVVKTDGTLWSFGSCEQDEPRLGDGSTVQRPIPTQVMSKILLPGQEVVESPRQEGVSGWAQTAVDYFAANGLMPEALLGDYQSTLTWNDMAAISTTIYEHVVKNPLIVTDTAPQVTGGVHAELIRRGYAYGLFDMEADPGVSPPLSWEQVEEFSLALYQAIEQKAPPNDWMEGALRNDGQTGESVTREAVVQMLYQQIERQLWLEQSVRLILS